MTWRLHDVAADPDAIEPADIVVLHRVVCCYPDYRRLLGAAADHARRFVVFSYPRRNPLSRLFVAGANLLTRAYREEFRAFVHPPSALLAVLRERGFRRVLTHRALVWQIAAFERESRASKTYRIETARRDGFAAEGDGFERSTGEPPTLSCHGGQCRA